MKALISGASGFVGQALIERWRESGHEVLPLVRERSLSSSETVYWSPNQDVLDVGKIEGFDVIVHLAGESIVGRWTETKKRRIRQSRVKGTALLARAVSGLRHPPGVFLCASAVGFYGDRGDEVLDESSESGTDFLAEVAREWEEASRLIEGRSRLVNMRFGVILDPSGGPLPAMMRPFRFGLGGPVGPGTQWQSWITLEDVLRAIDFIKDNDDIKGPVNVVSPNPVQQRAFAKSIGRALSRPSFLPVPSLAVKLLMGEMGRGLLLSSTRVKPKVLLDHGFDFEGKDIDRVLDQFMGEARA